MSEHTKEFDGENQYYGGVLVDDLERIAKTHARSALGIAYGEGLLVGINRAKETMQAEITRLKDTNKDLAEALEAISIGTDEKWTEKRAKQALAKAKGME